MPRPDRKPLGQMTDEEFEAYLKKNNIVGLAAVSACRKRKYQMVDAAASAPLPPHGGTP